MNYLKYEKSQLLRAKDGRIVYVHQVCQYPPPPFKPYDGFTPHYMVFDEYGELDYLNETMVEPVNERKCPECCGDGMVMKGYGSETCKNCYGFGKVIKSERECPECNGKGAYNIGIDDRVLCRSCTGTGKVSES